MTSFAAQVGAYLDQQTQQEKDKEAYLARRKVDLSQVPLFCEVPKQFDTYEIRDLAVKGLECVPAQFWVMPASMSASVHHESERGYGEVEFDPTTKLFRVKTIGGKAFHTLRVLKFLEKFLEADNARMRGGNPIYGNDNPPRDRDICRAAALWHDVYSGGIGDEFDYTRKRLDPMHAHYHREQLDFLKNGVKPDEWELLLQIVEAHMWKWDPTPKMVFFDDIKQCATVEEAAAFMRRYRLVKYVEQADLVAAQQI